MRNDYIKQHPNEAKFILCNKAYFALRYSLMAQISELERSIDGTALNTDVSIKKHILPSLKRTLKGLQKRFEKTEVRIDAMLCVQKLMEIEAQEIKEQPLQHCRYYKGESENPFEGKDQTYTMFWFYERCWIKHLNESNLKNELTEYIYYGLMDFSAEDDTPISLKAILFNRYCHWNVADVEAFKKWYCETYAKPSLL